MRTRSGKRESSFATKSSVGRAGGRFCSRIPRGIQWSYSSLRLRVGNSEGGVGAFAASGQTAGTIQRQDGLARFSYAHSQLEPVIRFIQITADFAPKGALRI